MLGPPPLPFVEMLLGQGQTNLLSESDEPPFLVGVTVKEKCFTCLTPLLGYKSIPESAPLHPIYDAFRVGFVLSLYCNSLSPTAIIVSDIYLPAPSPSSRHLGPSSLTGDRTWAPALAAQSHSRWTPRDTPTAIVLTHPHSF